jgi:hypothetical protein
MSEAQNILNMIESVDPSDTVKLEEIDARVQRYVDGQSSVELAGLECPDPQYTRSRDALKAIRSKMWRYNGTSQERSSVDNTFYCSFSIERDEAVFTLASPELPTEELTELHAIIQTIADDRENAMRKEVAA